MLKIRDVASTERALTFAAGKGGADAPVSRTHMVESLEIAKMFIERGELIFTTGAGLVSEGELLELAREAKRGGASGMVVNFGPYVSSLCAEVAAFADENDLPLFTCPWEVRMAEIMHRVSYLAEERERAADREAAAIKNALLRRDGWHTLKKFGWKEDTEFFVAAAAERPEYTDRGIYCLIMDEGAAAVFVDSGKDEIRRLTGEAPMAVAGPCGMQGLCGAYLDAKRLLAVLDCDAGPHFFDESGIYQLLLSIDDREVLKSYYENSIGKLARYDAKKKAGLIEALDTYIRCGSSLKEASEALGLHKNTVTNRVHKCEELLGRSMSDHTARMEVEVAMAAKKVLTLTEQRRV